MSSRVLITGVAGFIGAHLARECLRRGFDVVGLDDFSGGKLSNMPKGVRFVRGSITDHALVAKLFAAERFDYVFHLAACAAEGLSHFIRRFIYDTNVSGSMSLINAAVQNEVKCFVFASSIAVYGENQLPMREDLTPQPCDPYGISKYAVELDLRAAREMFGLNTIVFRPHNVYGELQNLCDRYRNVVGIFMSQLLRGEPMTIFGDGTQVRAFSYVGDVVRAMVGSVEMPGCYGEVFNIGADVPITVRELAHLVAATVGTEPRIVHLPARHEVQCAFADHSKFKRIFGQTRSTSLEEGLSRMVAWAKTVDWRTTAAVASVEITKSFPEAWGRPLTCLP
jgi:UDP-glucose 4-epimerase